MSDKYDRYRAAQQSGGPCEICGWREGEGIKECYYSPELGAVTHQNNRPTGLTAEQEELYDLEQSKPNAELVYLDEASREQRIHDPTCPACGMRDISPLSEGERV